MHQLIDMKINGGTGLNRVRRRIDKSKRKNKWRKGCKKSKKIVKF